MLNQIRWSFFFMVISCTTTFLDGSSQPSDQGQVPLIPRHILFGNPQKAAPQISPNGEMLAYLAPDGQDVLNVWVRNLKNPVEQDRKITSDAKRGIRSFLWQYDNEHILYVQDKDGDEDWHLFQTRLSTLETKDLTPFSGVTVGILAYDPHYPNEMLIQLNKRDPSAHDVYRLNLQTGQLDLDTENPGGVFDWTADHQLQVRLSQSYTAEGHKIVRLRDSHEDKWSDWLDIDPYDTVSIVEFTPDNENLYMLSNQGVNTTQLFQVNLKTKERKHLAEDPNYDISDVDYNPKTYALEVAGVDRDKHEWIVLDPSLKGEYEFLGQKFNTPFYVLSSDLADQQWIVSVQSDQHPSRFYLYNRQDKALTYLFTTLPELEKYPLNAMEPISFQARDGMLLHGYLTLPKGRESKHVPTVLFVHGGPWARDSWGLSPIVQWLSNRGYAVFQINFRGSTGYGKKYLNSGNREWGQKMHTDLLDGKEWLVKQGIADPNKVAIMGGSYGGYAVLAALTISPEAFCCGVDIVGPSNLITLLQTFPAYWAPIMKEMDLRVGKLETEQEFLKSHSPLFKADKIVKPLLIGHGANDPRVKLAESDQIVHAMRGKDIPVEYIVFADEGHGFARPQNKMIFYATVEDFLAKYLGGRQEPPKPEEDWKPMMR